MIKTSLVSLLTFLLHVTAPVVDAQPQAKIPWIGYLAGAGSGPSPAFIQGLRDLGFVEGKNIAFVFRTTEGKSERHAELAAELVQLKVDIIVTDGTVPSLAAKKATSSIPIVMTSATDPVRTGLVASYARPGGNVTGLSSVSGELGGKVLERLKETVPRLNRVALLRPVGPANDLFFKETEAPAQALGLQLIPFVVQGPDDFEGAFRAMTKDRSNGLLMRLPDAVYSDHFTSSGVNNEKSSTVDLYVNYLGGRWGTLVLWSRPQRYVPPRCRLRRQDSQRHKTSRLAG